MKGFLEKQQEKALQNKQSVYRKLVFNQRQDLSETSVHFR